METPAKNTQIPYIINTGSSGVAKPIVIGVLVIAGSYFGNKAYKKYLEDKGEKSTDTPEGAIALQLKNLFDKTFVSDEDFRMIYLSVNADNKDEVFRIYKLLSQRNLSDDMKRINTSTLVKSAKTEIINNKKEGVIKINANDDIEFLVAKGSAVKITDLQKAVTFYGSPKGLLWYLTASDMRPIISPGDKIKASIVGKNISMVVDSTMILPYSGIKLTADWTKYFKPLTNTRKVFAIVRVKIKKADGKTLFLWVDARELSKIVTLKGIEAPKCIGALAY